MIYGYRFLRKFFFNEKVKEMKLIPEVLKINDGFTVEEGEEEK